MADDRDFQELKEAVEKLTTKVQTLIDTNNKQSRDHDDIHDHRRILYGTSDSPGLIARMADQERWRASVVKVLWYVVAPLLTAIGAGVVILIAQSAKIAAGQ